MPAQSVILIFVRGSVYLLLISGELYDAFTVKSRSAKLQSALWAAFFFLAAIFLLSSVSAIAFTSDSRIYYDSVITVVAALIWAVRMRRRIKRPQ